MTSKIGVYPGSFDPVTNGHLDIIGRTAGIVDKLIVAVAANPGKNPMFSVDDRVAMLTEEIKISVLRKKLIIEVVPFNNLLIDFVQSVNALIIIRGLRAVSDFEYEFQMAGMNSRLNPKIETVFLMASDRNQFISSRFVKEIGRLGGDTSHFVSPRVTKRLRDKLKNIC